jgi:teichoic acid transport system permease protein
MADITLSPGETEGLFEPGTARAPREYLKRLWDLRHFMKAEARGKLASGHSELALGRGWLVLEPILYISVYFVLFGLALRTGRDLENIDFLSYLVVGKITFQFLNRGILSGSGALRGKRKGSLDSPQATLPLGHALRGALAYRVEIVVMFAMVMLRGWTPSLLWLFVIPLFLLMFAFALGTGLCLAPLIRRFPDIHPALTHVMRLAFYSSGIIFPVEVILLDTDNGLFWLRIYTFANPLFAFVKAQQALTFGYEPVPLEYVLASIAVWSFATLVFGFFWFVKQESA